MTSDYTTKPYTDGISLAGRIEIAYDDALRYRREMMEAGRYMGDAEETAKVDNADEFASAKNNDVRQVLLRQWLSDDTEYQAARKRYRLAQDEYKIARLEIARLELLVELSKAR